MTLDDSSDCEEDSLDEELTLRGLILTAKHRLGRSLFLLQKHGFGPRILVLPKLNRSG